MKANTLIAVMPALLFDPDMIIFLIKNVEWRSTHPSITPFGLGPYKNGQCGTTSLNPHLSSAIEGFDLGESFESASKILCLPSLNLGKSVFLL